MATVSSDGLATLITYDYAQIPAGGALDLTGITDSNGVPIRAIGPYALAGLPITSIVIPPSVTRIGLFAFNSCNSLTSVVIPETVIQVEDYIFNTCNSLTEATLPAHLATNSTIFNYCPVLTTLHISGTGHLFLYPS